MNIKHVLMFAHKRIKESKKKKVWQADFYIIFFSVHLLQLCAIAMWRCARGDRMHVAGGDKKVENNWERQKCGVAGVRVGYREHARNETITDKKPWNVDKKIIFYIFVEKLCSFDNAVSFFRFRSWHLSVFLICNSTCSFSPLAFTSVHSYHRSYIFAAYDSSAI